METTYEPGAAVKQHLLHLYDKFGIPASEPRRTVALARETLRRKAVSMPELEAASRRAAASGDPVNAGRDAFARRDWETAYTLLSAEDSVAPLPAEDMDRLAEAGWWTNRHEESFAARQRAHQAYLAADNKPRAAQMALFDDGHRNHLLPDALLIARSSRLRPRSRVDGSHRPLCGETGTGWATRRLPDPPRLGAAQTRSVARR